MHTVLQPADASPSTRRRRRPRPRGARRRRRRHRLHRPGTAAPARAASGGRAHGGDVVGRDGAAARAAAGARASVERRDRAARARTRSPREADVVFLALPDAAAAELAPALVDAGVRVIDLSGAFRLRDDAARARWYPETHALPDGVGLRAHRARARTRSRGARLVANPGCYPDRHAAGAGAARGRRPARCRTPTSSSTPSRASRAPARRRPSGRTFRKCTAACPPTACSAIVTARKSNRALGRTVTFTPHLVPLDRGILATIYVRVAPGTTEEALGDVFERAYARRDVRAARRIVAARNQARRAHELLRHRLARRRVGPRDSRVGHRQPAEGRVGPGRAEHERDARLDETAGLL